MTQTPADEPRIPEAPKKVRDALHKAWLAERPESARKADLRLRIGWGVLLLAVLAVAAVGAEVGPKWLIWASLGTGAVASFFILRAAQRIYRNGLMQFFYDRLDDDGVLTLCAGCGYDLRGTKPPRRKCPECGKATWKVTDDNPGGV